MSPVEEPSNGMAWHARQACHGPTKTMDVEKLAQYFGVNCISGQTIHTSLIPPPVDIVNLTSYWWKLKVG